jgi:hypothetical protein
MWRIIVKSNCASRSARFDVVFLVRLIVQQTRQIQNPHRPLAYLLRNGTPTFQVIPDGSKSNASTRVAVELRQVRLRHQSLLQALSSQSRIRYLSAYFARLLNAHHAWLRIQYWILKKHGMLAQAWADVRRCFELEFLRKRIPICPPAIIAITLSLLPSSSRTALQSACRCPPPTRTFRSTSTASLKVLRDLKHFTDFLRRGARIN